MRFLLVDRILRMERGKEAIIRKNVSNSEDFFAEHFAGRPIMPGCLILETCDQAARLLLGKSSDFTLLPALQDVANGKFQHFVQPGDSLQVHVVLVSQKDGSAEVRASASVDDRTVARVSLTYRLVDSAEDPGAARACARMKGFYEILTTDPVSIALENRARATGQGKEGDGA
jgi:3-hydroxyacyl-[acyl-carrier-protein] dehydratase